MEIIMADRVSVTIRIGGALPKAALSAFLQAIESEALTDPLGEYFSASQITGDNPLDMGANDVAWGRLEELEPFCVEHRLPFERWCGSYPGSWEAERIVFDGVNEPRSYTVTENDSVVVTEAEVRSLGSIEAILAYFQSARPGVPPFRVIDLDEERDDG
jgi:hypothetical protein